LWELGSNKPPAAALSLFDCSGKAACKVRPTKSDAPVAHPGARAQAPCCASVRDVWDVLGRLPRRKSMRKATIPAGIDVSATRKELECTRGKTFGFCKRAFVRSRVAAA